MMTHDVAVFGEVLFDHFPDGSRVLGGAPFNVAWHLQAFGHAPLFISRVGRDDEGEEITQAMVKWGMSTEGLQVDNDHPTGSVDVQLVAGEPRYEIVQDRGYDFIQADELPGREARVLYSGTLALRNQVSRKAYDHLVRSYRADRKRVHFVDVNLRSPWWGKGFVLQTIQEAGWVKLNFEELVQLTEESIDPPDRLAAKFLRERQLKGLVVTLGSEGAFVVTSDDEQVFTVRPRRNNRVVDTVGAGDAFTAVLIAGQVRGWPIPLCLERAQAFASRVVELRGAITPDTGFYSETLHQWEGS